METNLSSSAPAEIETECLVVIVLDRTENDRSEKDRSETDRTKNASGEKAKPELSIETSDNAIHEAARDVIATGEVTGKIFESTLLHNPSKLKAKRLLLVGGGKAKNFAAFELRKMAGTAVRTLKPKGIRSLTFVAPENGINAEVAVKAIVEGAFVGNFDPDTYKSDRKDQKIDSVTIIARGDYDERPCYID